MKATVTTPESYLASFPKDRAEALTKLRSLILENLPKGYDENIRWGLISYEVPLSVYPDTYNKMPLQYAGLANRKNYMSLYLVSPMLITEHEQILTRSGKKLKRGKSCINFNSLDELPLDDLKELFQKSDIQGFIDAVKKVSFLRAAPTKKTATKAKAAKKKTAAKPAAKKAAVKKSAKKAAPKPAAKKKATAKPTAKKKASPAKKASPKKK